MNRAVCILATGAATVEARIILNSVGIAFDLIDEQPRLASGEPGLKTYSTPARDIAMVPRRLMPTLREQQILRLLADGCTNDEAGERLGLAGQTVKTHLQRLFKKIGARDRAHAVAIAYQHGILGGPR